MSFIEELLQEIATAGGLMPPYKAYRGNFRGKQVTYYQSLNRLEKRGLIRKLKNPNDEAFYQITVQGQKLLKKPLKRINRKDGFSTLVAFDIPETKRRQRNIFRRFLVRNGYTIIQKSLLVSPHEIDHELLELITELKIRPFIKIVSGKFDYV